MRVPAILCLAGTLALPGCLAPRGGQIPHLASAEVAPDFDTYEIRRIGLLPFEGREVSDTRSRVLQEAFLSEISRSTPWEIVILEPRDLELVAKSEPHRRGWYRPKTLIELARRHSLDAVLFGTVTEERFYPPQLLGLSMDLVSSETGLVIWSSSVHLDATDRRVLSGLQAFYGAADSDTEAGEGMSMKVALISPERFARFAAYQVASLL